MSSPGELDETHASSFDSDPFALLCRNVTSSTKPEVHNVLHCRQRTETEPRPQIARAENLAKSGRVVLETCERTEKHGLRIPIGRRNKS